MAAKIFKIIATCSSLVLMIIILITILNVQTNSAQIFRQSRDGFQVGLGELFNLNYDRLGRLRGRRGFDINALSGLFNYNQDRRLGRDGINVDALGLGRSGR